MRGDNVLITDSGRAVLSGFAHAQVSCFIAGGYSAQGMLTTVCGEQELQSCPDGTIDALSSDVITGTTESHRWMVSYLL